MRDIEVYTNVDAQYFNEHILTQHRPAVLKGLVSHWPSVTMTTDTLVDHLVKTGTDIPVAYFAADPEWQGRMFYAEGYTAFNYQQERSTLADFFARLVQEAQSPRPAALFAGSLALAGHFPQFLTDNHINGFIPANQLIQSMWIGNHTLTAPHYDNVENIACVVAGRRRFTLFPIEQYPNLYVGPLDLTPAGQPISLVDIRAPDFDRFPKYRQAEAEALTAVLDPGDAIYIPTLWWHGVESLDPINIMVNTWWRDVPSYFGSPTTALMHAVLALRDLPAHQRTAWQAVFDHLVFETNGPALDHLPAAARGMFGDLTRSSAAQIRHVLTQLKV